MNTPLDKIKEDFAKRINEAMDLKGYPDFQAASIGILFRSFY